MKSKKIVLALIVFLAMCMFALPCEAGKVKLNVTGKNLDDLKIEWDFSKVDRTNPEEVMLTFFAMQIDVKEDIDKIMKLIGESYISDMEQLLEMEALLEIKKNIGLNPEGSFKLKGFEQNIISKEINDKEARFEVILKPVFEKKEGVDGPRGDDGQKFNYTLIKDGNNWFVNDVTMKCYSCRGSGVCIFCDDQRGPRRFRGMEKKPDKDGAEDDPGPDVCDNCKGSKKCPHCKGTGNMSLFDKGSGLALPDSTKKYKDAVIDCSSSKAAVESAIASYNKHMYIANDISLKSVFMKFAETFLSRSALDRLLKGESKYAMSRFTKYEKITVSEDGTTVSVQMETFDPDKEGTRRLRKFRGKPEEDEPLIHKYNMIKGDDGKWKIINRMTKCDNCNNTGKCWRCDGGRDRDPDNKCERCHGAGNCPDCNGTMLKKIPFTLPLSY